MDLLFAEAIEPTTLQRRMVPDTIYGSDTDPSRRHAWQLQSGSHSYDWARADPSVGEGLRLWCYDLQELLDELTFVHSAMNTLGKILGSILYHLGGQETQRILRYPAPVAITTAGEQMQKHLEVCKRQTVSLNNVTQVTTAYNQDMNAFVELQAMQMS